MKFPSAQFLNEGPSGTLLVEISNELHVGEDGWAQIAPLGDFPGMALTDDGKGGMKKAKAIQRIDATAVAQMVNSYNGARRGPSRFLRGAPIYHGHPDVPGYERKYPDKSPKGVFPQLAARDTGLFGEVILFNDGEELLAGSKKMGLSGRWHAEKIGEENGTPVYRPHTFISAGLTPTPNLPVQLLNEAESSSSADADAAGAIHNHNTMKKSVVIALLQKLGVQIANDATDEQVSEQLDKAAGLAETLVTSKATLANEKDTLAGTVTARDGTITTLTQERDTLKSERDTARTNFANERTQRIEREVAIALTDGRITKAEEADWKRRLGVEAQFSNEVTALTKLEKKVKTESVTLDRKGTRVELANEAERTAFINEAIDEEIRDNKLTPTAAREAVKKKFPALFAAMKKPTIKMPRK